MDAQSIAAWCVILAFVGGFARWCWLQSMAMAEQTKMLGRVHHKMYPEHGKCMEDRLIDKIQEECGKTKTAILQELKK